jgi:hypothetical protein
MRRAVAVSVVLVSSLLGCADAITPNNRPSVTVAGLVSNASSQPVPNADVSVQAWAPNNCGTGSALQSVTTKTNPTGIYRVELIAASAGYSACIRSAVGATSRDTTVTNVPPFSTVQLNLSVP